MEPSEAREKIEDLKQRYGYEENEAEAAYYLREARDRFTKIYRDEAEKRAEVESEGMPKLWAQMFLMSNVHPHFQALNSLLVDRAIRRKYPEGWDSQPAREDEEQPE